MLHVMKWNVGKGGCMENYYDSVGATGVAGVLDDASKNRRPRVLLVDDDPVFRAVMVRLAIAEGIDIEAYESLLEVEPFSRMQSYNGAIFDYHLGQLDGQDIANCLKPFFKSVPAMLVSCDEAVGGVVMASPSCPFKEFVSKRLGGMKIIERMKDLLKQHT
jgi:CheY-like chemotaxis protein